jgi:hypothetical protein
LSGKIENILTNGRKKLFPELAENTEFSLMKIKSRGGKYSSALFYLFINGSLKPDYLLKVNRSPFYFEAIEKEFENLKLVYNRVFERGLQIPKPKFCIRSDENVILCESYIQGEPFLNLISGLSETEKITEYLDKGFAWLIRFQDAVRTSEERADEKWIKINVSDIIKTFLDKYPDIEVKDFLREIPVLFLEFKDKIMPLVISQGDYDQWNILSDNGKISVIDWEDTKLSTNPYDDIYTFIFHLALLSDPCKKEEENFNSFFQVNSFTYSNSIFRHS